MKRGRRPALTPEQAEHARWLYDNTTLSMEEVGQRFGVSGQTIKFVIECRGAYRAPKNELTNL